jgi:hypothetical protein
VLRLLGTPRAESEGEELRELKLRGLKLLICMALKPLERATWPPFLSSEELPKAKGDVREEAPDWIEAGYGVYRLRRRPTLDIELIPADDQAALDYCVARGEFLAGVDLRGTDWIEALRDAHHARLVGIVGRLCEAAPGQAESIRRRAATVLPQRWLPARGGLHLTGRSDDLRPAVVLNQLRSGLQDGERPDVAGARDLRRVVAGLLDAAVALRPPPPEIVDRASWLVSKYERQVDDCDWDRVHTDLANVRWRSADTRGAAAELRGWLNDPRASSNALCTAALLCVDLGHTERARELFDQSAAKATLELQLEIRDKRDLELARLRGNLDTARTAAHALKQDPLFDSLTPGARASVFYNHAKVVGSPLRALALAQRARTIDQEAGRPHYDLALAGYAERAGKTQDAERYRASFEELAADRWSAALDDQVASQRIERLLAIAHPAAIELDEADELADQLLERRLRAGHLPDACIGLVSLASISQRRGELARAYELALTGRSIAKQSVLGTRGAADALISNLSRSIPRDQQDRHTSAAQERVAEIIGRFAGTSL